MILEKKILACQDFFYNFFLQIVCCTVNIYFLYRELHIVFNSPCFMDFYRMYKIYIVIFSQIVYCILIRGLNEDGPQLPR